MGVLVNLIPEWQDRKDYYIAIDFDGTLVVDEFPNIGKLKQATIELIKNKEAMLKAIGKTVRLILWTCRSDKALIAAVAFCKENNIGIYAVNENPDYQTGSDKIYADEYWDDRAVNIGVNDEN